MRRRALFLPALGAAVLGLSGCTGVSQTDAGAMCLQEQGQTLQSYFYEVRGNQLAFVPREGGSQEVANALTACLQAKVAGRTTPSQNLTAVAAMSASTVDLRALNCSRYGAPLRGGSGYCIGQ